MTKEKLLDDPRDLDYPETVYQYRCPNCGDAHHIDVVVKAWTRFQPTDEGDLNQFNTFAAVGELWSTSQIEAMDGNDDWEPESEAVCRFCDYEATVAGFTNPQF